MQSEAAETRLSFNDLEKGTNEYFQDRQEDKAVSA
jgi:hypothetical protein